MHFGAYNSSMDVTIISRDLKCELFPPRKDFASLISSGSNDVSIV